VAEDDVNFKRILAAVRAATGVDFTQYRDTTIRRSNMRRMALRTQRSLADYVGLLDVESAEVDALYRDLLINVTSFFRDPEMFEMLKRSVLPETMKSKAPNMPLRIWVAGCSTGQEPYSIAMAIREHFPELATWNLTILGTDISPTVLERARRGRYGQLEVNRGLPAHLLVRHFTRAGMEWEIEESIRRMVRFQRRNLINEWAGLPPFDIVFMRNVMIYFDVESKREVLARMHGQLAANGYLLLGASETTFNLSKQYERQLDGRTAWYRPTRTDPFGGAGR
jgi:chemotaxis protein methyltransferase CheR